jgi:hypothetical protein
LATLRSDHAFLSDVEWMSAKVGWGEPAGNHLWVDDREGPTIALIVHGRLYAKGLYAPAPSRYTFALAAEWNVFTSTVGLQDGANVESAAIFVVRGDGRELFRSPLMRVNASQQLKVEVVGVKELELLTEHDGGEGRFSRAIWADALVRR